MKGNSLRLTLFWLLRTLPVGFVALNPDAFFVNRAKDLAQELNIESVMLRPFGSAPDDFFPAGNTQQRPFVFLLQRTNRTCQIHALVQHLHELLVDAVDLQTKSLQVLPVAVAYVMRDGDFKVIQQLVQVVGSDLLFGIAQCQRGLKMGFNHQSFHAEVHGPL